jgi:cell division protein FtsI (penicillin-binding protein 3)
VGARLAYLQTSQHEWLARRARAQQTGVETEQAVRGLILDRQGRELARSVDVDSFFADPREVETVEDTAGALAGVLDLDALSLSSKLKEAKDAKRGFVWLARKVDPERSQAVRALKLKGVYSIEEQKRRYPNGPLAAHVLGYVGLDENGLAGVEQIYDASLKGEAGRVVFDKDGKRKSFESEGRAPQDGRTVVLTIDQTVQYIVERELAAAVERTHAKSAAAVVLEPQTGEVLALANAPTFNPNEASTVSDEARRNDALQNIYEPGSTFKLVAYTAALEEKLITPETRIQCEGSISLPGRVVHDHAHGSLTATEALRLEDRRRVAGRDRRDSAARREVAAGLDWLRAHRARGRRHARADGFGLRGRRERRRESRAASRQRGSRRRGASRRARAARAATRGERGDRAPASWDAGVCDVERHGEEGATRRLHCGGQDGDGAED